MLYAIVALLVIVLDQWTKLWVATNSDMFPRTLIEGFVSLVTAQNKGVAFGLFGDKTAALDEKTMTVIFIAVAGFVALLTIILLATNLVKGGLGRWSLVFIAAGGLSNAIDRLLNDGAVLDMIKLDVLDKVNINFPIFNVADIFISVFSVLLILYVIFGGRKKAEGDDEEEDAEEDEAELEDEEEEDRPRRRSRNEPEPAPAPEPEPEKEQPRKKNRQSYEEDYERYKARKAQEPLAPAAEESAPPVDPEDPFAEWERANRKQNAPAEQTPPAPAPVEEAPRPAEKPRTEAPKPAPAPASEEFSLDDILAEFK